MPQRNFWLVVLLALCFWACGGDTVNVNNVTPTPQGPTGSIDVQFRLLQRGVPSSIDQFRFIGLDANGRFTFGPETRDKAAQILLTGVPVETTVLRIEYLSGGVLRGIGNTPVSVPEDGTAFVVDPDFEDVGQVVERIEVTPLARSIPSGVTLAFQATAITFDGGTADVTSSVTWTSSDPAVASIGNQPGSFGVALGLAPGSTTISADLAGLSDSTSLTVTSATLTQVLVEPTNPVAGAGTTLQFQAFGVYSDQSFHDLTAQVTWTSSAPAVATIQSPGGLARALAPGTSVITAVEPASGLGDGSLLTVTAAALTRLAVEPGSVTRPVGLSEQLQVVGQYADGSIQNLTSLATFSSDNPGVASVNALGLATAVSPGTAVITARVQGLSATCQFQSVAASIVSVAVQPATLSLPRGLTSQLEAVATLDNGQSLLVTDLVVWSSSNPAVAEVSNVAGQKGVLKGLNFGQASAVATLAGVQGQAAITVSSATLQSLDVLPATDTVPLGETSELRAIGLFSDGTSQDVTTFVTWTTTDQSIAFVSNTFPQNGLVSGEGLGNAQVTATDPVTGLTDFCDVTVTPAVLVAVSVVPDPLQLGVLGTQRMLAVGTFSDASTENLSRRVWWSSNDVLVVTITNLPFVRGIALGLIPGTAVIRAEHSSGLTGTSNVTVRL